MNPRRLGVTLIEVLVGVGVVSILMSLALPAVQKARGAAARASCQNNLKQIGLALTHYEGAHGHFPPWVPASTWDTRVYYPVTWLARILPQMGEDELWRATDRASKSGASVLENPPNIGLLTVIKPYLCPADGRFGSAVADRDGLTAAMTGYIGAVGPRGGVLAGSPRGTRFAEITDGASNTIAAGERPPPDTLQAGKWYTFLAPRQVGYWGDAYGPDCLLDTTGLYIQIGEGCERPVRFGPGVPGNPCDRIHFWSLHTGGANFLLADGAVKFGWYGAHDAVVAMTSPAGGEVAALD